MGAIRHGSPEHRALLAAAKERIEAEPIDWRSVHKRRVIAAREALKDEFRRHQHQTREWISIDEIAAIRADAGLSSEEDALAWIMRKAARDEISPLLRVTAAPRYRLRRCWLRDPDSAPAIAFVSSDYLEQVENRTPEGATWLIAQCWLPRATAAKLLDGVPTKPAWATASVSTASDSAIPQSINAAPSEAVPARIKNKPGPLRQYDHVDFHLWVAKTMNERGEFREWDVDGGWRGLPDLKMLARDYLARQYEDGGPGKTWIHEQITKALEQWRAQQAKS